MGFGALLAALLSAGPAGAGETAVSFYLGASFTGRSDVHVQRGGDSLRYHGVRWRTRSFRFPLYYGVRVTHVPQAAPHLGLVLDFVHDKAHADTGEPRRVTGRRDGADVDTVEPLATSLRELALSHGANYLTVSVTARCCAPRSGARAWAGAGVGVAIPHVEAQGDEGGGINRYQLSGPVWQGLAGGEIDSPTPWIAGFGEWRYSHASLDLAVPGGRMRTVLRTHHLAAGGSLRYRPPGPDGGVAFARPRAPLASTPPERVEVDESPDS